MQLEVTTPMGSSDADTTVYFSSYAKHRFGATDAIGKSSFETTQPGMNSVQMKTLTAHERVTPSSPSYLDHSSFRDNSFRRV